MLHDLQRRLRRRPDSSPDAAAGPAAGTSEPLPPLLMKHPRPAAEARPWLKTRRLLLLPPSAGKSLVARALPRSPHLLLALLLAAAAAAPAEPPQPPLVVVARRRIAPLRLLLLTSPAAAPPCDHRMRVAVALSCCRCCCCRATKDASLPLLRPNQCRCVSMASTCCRGATVVAPPVAYVDAGWTDRGPLLLRRLWPTCCGGCCLRAPTSALLWRT